MDGRLRLGLLSLMAAGLLFAAAGCTTTPGTVLVDADGADLPVTPEEVYERSGPEMPYLVQVGDQLDIGFYLEQYHAGRPEWDYRVEPGDRMEIRLAAPMGDREQYRIDVGDLVGVSFLNNWPLNATRTVRPDGYVTFEAIGAVKAAGLTTTQLESVLDDRYAETGIIEGDPNITVTLDFANPDRLENISRDVVVRPDGKVRLPVLQEDILVAGLTVDEASGKVEAAAEAVLRNPVVVSMVLFPAVRSTLDDMSGSYTIRPDGKITVPRLGELQAAGYSTPELQRELAMLAGGVVHNPVKPSVGVAQATGARIYVGGEVALPGVYPLQGAPSALQAILMARGATDRARLDSVLVIRRNPTGKPFVFKTNLAEALDGRTENDLMLRSFDVVYVPMKPISKANLFVQQYIDDIVPFDNSLGVTGTYYLNEQETRTKSRNVNFSTGVSVVPGVGLVP